jgi:hypothetical protein
VKEVGRVDTYLDVPISRCVSNSQYGVFWPNSKSSQISKTLGGANSKSSQVLSRIFVTCDVGSKNNLLSLQVFKKRFGFSDCVSGVFARSGAF